jgi:signal transduction histidine kinase
MNTPAWVRQRYLSYFLLVSLVVALVITYWARGGNVDYVFMTQAETAVTDSYEFPDEYAQWRSIPLPRSWMRDELHSSRNDYAWYRMPLPAQAAEHNWHQLLILRHMMNIEIWLDDRYLGSAGPVSSQSLQRNWNRPVMWSIPSGWITGDHHMLYFRLHSAPDFGVMSPVILGDYEAVTQRYRLNYFLQIELVRIGLMALLFIGALSLFAWQKTNQQHWLLTLLMSSSWSLPLLYIVTPSVAFGEFDFLRLSHWGTVTGAICLLAFIYVCYLNTPLSRLRWLFALPLGHGVLLAAIPDAQVVNIGSAGQLLAQLLFVILIIKLISHRSRHDQQVTAVVIGLAIMLLAAAHDVSLVLSTSVERWRWDLIISYVTQPIMLLILAWIALSSYIKDLKALKQLNNTLRTRLSDAESDIRLVYIEQEKLEREIRIVEERETVYRDLHDDLGARLLSLILKTDQGSARDLARSTLQDLRDIVSRVVADEHCLADTLADSMAEHEARSSELAKTFDWHIDSQLDSATLGARQLLSMRLMLRELIGSCLRIPDATFLVCSAELDPTGDLIITLAHDGSECLPVTAVLRKRINALHGTFEQFLAHADNADSRQHRTHVKIPVQNQDPILTS